MPELMLLPPTSPGNVTAPPIPGRPCPGRFTPGMLGVVGRLGRVVPGRFPPEPGLGFGRVPGLGRTSGSGRIPGVGRVCPPSDGRVPGLVDGMDGAGMVGLTSAGGRVIGLVFAGGKLGRVDGLVTCGGFTSGRAVLPPPRFGMLGSRLPGSPIPIDGLLFPSEGIEGRVGNVEGLLGEMEGREEP